MISTILTDPDREYSRFLWVLFQDQLARNTSEVSCKEIYFFQLVYIFLFKQDHKETTYYLNRCESIQDWPQSQQLSIRLIGLIVRDQHRYKREYELLNTFLKLKNVSKDCIICEVLWRRLEKQVFLRMKTCTHSQGLNRLLAFDSLYVPNRDFELDFFQSIAYEA